MMNFKTFVTRVGELVMALLGLAFALGMLVNFGWIVYLVFKALFGF